MGDANESPNVAGKVQAEVAATDADPSTSRHSSAATGIRVQDHDQPHVDSDPKASERRATFESTVSSPQEEFRPPLPPRPTTSGHLQTPKQSPRPTLLSSATTALSRADINTQVLPDGGRETYQASADSTPSKGSLRGLGSPRRFKGIGGSDGDDSASIRSYAPTLETGGDVESLLGEILGASQDIPAWRLLSTQLEKADPFDFVDANEDYLETFDEEFDEVGTLNADGSNEGMARNLCTKFQLFDILVEDLPLTVDHISNECS